MKAADMIRVAKELEEKQHQMREMGCVGRTWRLPSCPHYRPYADQSGQSAGEYSGQEIFVRFEAKIQNGILSGQLSLALYSPNGIMFSSSVNSVLDTYAMNMINCLSTEDFRYLAGLREGCDAWLKGKLDELPQSCDGDDLPWKNDPRAK